MDTSIHVVRARRPRHRPFLGEAQLVLPQPRSRAWGPTGCARPSAENRGVAAQDPRRRPKYLLEPLCP